MCVRVRVRAFSCTCTCACARARARACACEKVNDVGWLRLVGSLKLKVSFAEYRLFYKALLQKRPIILRSVLIVATPQPHFKERTNRFKERTNRSHTTATF